MNQIPFVVFLSVLAFAVALFVSLILTIGWASTLGFYGLSGFLFILLCATAEHYNE